MVLAKLYELVGNYFLLKAQQRHIKLMEKDYNDYRKSFS